LLIVEPTQLETEYHQDSEQGLHATVDPCHGKSWKVREYRLWRECEAW
jgi:hypothetical protein